MKASLLFVWMGFGMAMFFVGEAAQSYAFHSKFYCLAYEMEGLEHPMQECTTYNIRSENLPEDLN